MAYSNITDPSAYFQTVLYTGNAGTLAITNDGNSDLQPDWIWLKSRGVASHNIYDSSRGQGKHLAPDITYQEITYHGVTAFNSDGFTLSSGGDMNYNGASFVAWQWKANGGTVTTTPNGTQTTNNMQMATKHQINSDAGFSICTYQGATSYGSFYHGLGVKPNVVIIKSRTNAYDWVVYHSSLGYTTNLYLNETAAGDASTAFFPAEPNTTQVYCKDHNSVFRPNGADSYLAYCFAEKQGYSKFGSYVGNGNADGTFVYTGFKPAFLIMKRTDSTGAWHIFDNKRLGYNINNNVLQADANAAELAGADYPFVDILSNGFKTRRPTHGPNVSGGTYIYMAFAESPFVAGGVPTTAR